MFVKQCRNSISGLWYIMYHKNKCILLLQRASEGMLRLLLFLYANIWQHFMQYMDPTIYDFILNKNKNKNFWSKMCIAYWKLYGFTYFWYFVDSIELNIIVSNILDDDPRCTNCKKPILEYSISCNVETIWTNKCNMSIKRSPFSSSNCFPIS